MRIRIVCEVAVFFVSAAARQRGSFVCIHLAQKNRRIFSVMRTWRLMTPPSLCIDA